jgi:ATP-binding cassette, subfamily B, beta-glucan exporter
MGEERQDAADKAPLSMITCYRRGLALLAAEKPLAVALSLAGVVIAVIQLAEPILFGKVVDALSRDTPASLYIGLWAALGLVGIAGSVVVAVLADRLAHRRRLTVLSEAFERAMTLPLSYHARAGSGAVVRTLLSGTDTLFWLWLGVMREQLTAVVGIVLLAPTALGMDWRMGLILFGLAIVYAAGNVFVMRKTSAGQTAVERHHGEVYGRVGDVLSNVTIVQSYARLAAEAEALRARIGDLLGAQYPVLTWWGTLNVITRAAATITMVAVFALGAVLRARGELTVGEIVSFVAFAGLLIGRLEQLSSFLVRMHQARPSLSSFFALLDEQPSIAERPGAKPLPPVKGTVRYEHVSFRYGAGLQGVFDIELEAKAGETVALVGPTGSGKTTTLALLQRLRAHPARRIRHRRRDAAVAAPVDRRRLPGRGALKPLDRREHPHRPPRRQRGRGDPRRRIGRGPWLHLAPARRLRHPGR